MADTFWSLLRPASWRGFPFAVLDGVLAFGRRNAVHEYPYRDQPWIEDMGRQARRIRVVGFIYGDDVAAQRDRLIRLSEEAQDGELVHPTLGVKRVALMDLQSIERKDKGRYFELHFSFVEQGARIYPSATNTTQSTTLAAAQKANAANVSYLVDSMRDLLAGGQAVRSQVQATTAQWVEKLDAVGQSIGLAPGRLQLAGAALIGDIAHGAKSRAGLNLALSILNAETANLGTSTVGKYAASFINSIAAAAATRKLSRDSILTMLGFAAQGVVIDSIPTSYPQGVQMAGAQSVVSNFAARSGVVAAANASASYMPTSSADASSVRDMLSNALDMQIDRAGDQGDDVSYAALRSLRAAVADDLNTRAASLPALVTVITPGPIPALVLANRLYGDADRAEELIAESGAIHPAFMPLQFQALSS